MKTRYSRDSSMSAHFRSASVLGFGGDRCDNTRSDDCNSVRMSATFSHRMLRWKFAHVASIGALVPNFGVTIPSSSAIASAIAPFTDCVDRVECSGAGSKVSMVPSDQIISRCVSSVVVVAEPSSNGARKVVGNETNFVRGVCCRNNGTQCMGSNGFASCLAPGIVDREVEEGLRDRFSFGALAASEQAE